MKLGGSAATCPAAGFIRLPSSPCCISLSGVKGRGEQAAGPSRDQRGGREGRGGGSSRAPLPRLATCSPTQCGRAGNPWRWRLQPQQETPPPPHTHTHSDVDPPLVTTADGPTETTDEASVKAAAKQAEARLGGAGLNLLINNAGVMPACTLESATAKDMLDVYSTNLVGPMLVAKEFLPLLKKAAQASKEKGMCCGKAAIINMSTILGSIEKTPEQYFFIPVVSYRCSKAALNMLTKCQSMGYRDDGILCTAIHPGWVKTELGSEQADLTVEESVNGIMKTLCSLSEKQHGILVTWEGNVLPW
ncbi:C-factor-like isoform X1 [Hemicordylus capensis]|uniref:C-factor-like isoform X1 n=1 Tax=Hemicordylus capensis TaxID=884348 RepID=UPI0023028523|nr:C-factor-like isoform X1 [Hemicordylus capensis]